MIVIKNIFLLLSVLDFFRLNAALYFIYPFLCFYLNSFGFKGAFIILFGLFDILRFSCLLSLNSFRKYFRYYSLFVYTVVFFVSTIYGLQFVLAIISTS